MITTLGISEAWQWVIGGGFLGLLILLSMMFPCRLGKKSISCPKCRRKAVARPATRAGEPGGVCPRCGVWSPLVAWRQIDLEESPLG